jgi:glucose-6-phosphate isomerase
MVKFSQSKTYQKLKELATKAYDLTAPHALSPERIEKYRAGAKGIELLYGTERIDDQVVENLYALAQERGALDWMRRMQEGEVINKIDTLPSENRRVLHTAMRDLFSTEKRTAPVQEAIDASKREHAKLSKFLKQVQARGITHMVQLGIGGSELGPKAVAIALEREAIAGRHVHFISNIDPDEPITIFSKLPLENTLCVVVSKSGSTLETAINEEIARGYFIRAGLDPKLHVVAVTGEKSPMDDPSKYLEAFYMWDFVGGRYSVCSMVGAVALGFLIGEEKLHQFLRGAYEMDRVALSQDPKENLPLLGALLGIWNRNFLGHPSLAILPYSQALSRFSAHLQQCDMESNGKHIDRSGERVDFNTGPLIWGEPGTNGQHSFYQLLHQGSDIIPAEFIGFKVSQLHTDFLQYGSSMQEKLVANLFAHSIALATGKKDGNANKECVGNRPNHVLLAHHLDPYTMGLILSYYENKVAFQGFIWGINSFDQEGVQLGKVLANQIIDLFRVERGELKTCEPFPAASAMIKILKGIDSPSK